MLDQNTDRMWYVIGALVVGAGIILLANKTMPELFASVGDSMSDALDESWGVVESLGKYGDNQMQGYVIHPSSQGSAPEYKQVIVDTSRFESDDIIYMESYYLSDGLYLQLDDLDLKHNTEYRLSYTVERVKGNIYNIGGHTDGPFSDNDFYIDGQKVDQPYMLSGGYNDVPPTQLFDGTGDVYDVEVFIRTSDSWEAAEGHVDYGGRLYIQINRSYRDAPVAVNIHNLEIAEVL